MAAYLLEIYFHALMIAKKSIIEKPFGWGLNRYDKAFDYFNKTSTSKKHGIKIIIIKMERIIL